MINLMLGDSIELMKDIPDHSIDLILTDPPYLAEYIHLYDDLSHESPRILKPGSLVIAYVGHFHLNTVMQMFSQHLEYYWIFCMKNGGTSAMMWNHRIEVHWKPIIAFSNGKPTENNRPISDLIRGSGRSKVNHEWEQGMSELYPFIRKFTDFDSIILDPFMGSGTTGVASLRLDRNFIGMEIDPDTFQVAKDRIENARKQEKLVIE